MEFLKPSTDKPVVAKEDDKTRQENQKTPEHVRLEGLFKKNLDKVGNEYYLESDLGRLKFGILSEKELAIEFILSDAPGAGSLWVGILENYCQLKNIKKLVAYYVYPDTEYFWKQQGFTPDEKKQHWTKQIN